MDNKLTYEQKSMLNIELFYPEKTVNNIQGILKFYQKIGYEIINQKFKQIEQENDVLHIQIEKKGEEYIQKFTCKSLSDNLEILDFQGKEKEYKTWKEYQAKTLIFAYNKYLYQAKYLIEPDGNEALFFTGHHTIVDLYSVGLLFGDFIKLLNKDVITDRKVGSYLEFVEKENQYIETEKYQKHKEFWANKIKDYCGCSMFKDKVLDSTSYNKTVHISDELQSQIRQFCNEYKISVYTFFMSIIAYMKHNITGKNSVVIGTPVLNRTTPSEKNTIGMFVNTLPMFTKIDYSDSIIDYIYDIQKSIIGVFRNRKYSYESILSLYVDEKKDYQDLLEIVLSYENIDIDQTIDKDQYSIEWCHSNDLPVALRITVSDREESLTLRYEYQASKLNSKTISWLNEDILNLCNLFSCNVKKKIAEYKDSLLYMTNLENDMVQYENEESKQLLYSNIQEKLLDIWKENLGVDKINFDDNYFELGGNSIKAMIMSSRIKEELGKELSFSIFFKHQTFKELLEEITKEKSEPSKYDSYVTLLNNKCERCIFAFPPLAGWGLYYKELALKITSSSVYAIDFIEEEDRIKQYVKLITTYQKQGPYILLGYSIGANIAYEVTKELELQGYAVSDIIILDATVREKKMKMNEKKFRKQVNKFLKDLVELNDFLYWLQTTALSEYTDEEAIYDIAYKKVEKGGQYLMDMVNSGKVDANIHMIRTDKEHKILLDHKKRWKLRTTKNYSEERGKGKHLTMLEGENLISNSKLLDDMIKML
jgi:thioesterase domain-containing protein/acyl carrier protein